MGAGVGRDTLHFQEQFETVAIEISEHLVRTMQDRGVEDAHRADMFSLRDHFERDRFGTAYAFVTPVQLVGSLSGFQRFLSDLVYVTTSDAAVILHGYAPELDWTGEILAYRADPAPGRAYRIFHCEYEGDVGRTLLFRLFILDRRIVLGASRIELWLSRIGRRRIHVDRSAHQTLARREQPSCRGSVYQSIPRTLTNVDSGNG